MRGCARPQATKSHPENPDLIWEQEAVGSNPTSPTKRRLQAESQGFQQLGARAGMHACSISAVNHLVAVGEEGVEAISTPHPMSHPDFDGTPADARRRRAPARD